jgi:predicted transcriptional regulator of viral defense system
VVANRVVSGSYVSLQAALAYYGHIPEHTPVVTSVTARRPGEWETPFGHFTYRHIQTNLFWGYEYLQVSGNQFAFVATPAKALLDLIYLQSGGDSEAFIESLRLQNLDQFGVDEVMKIAEQTGKPKLRRAARRIARLVAAEAEDYQTL